MNHHRLNDGTLPHHRIDKRAARLAWNAGKPVVFCPCNLMPFGGFRSSVMAQKSAYASDFDEAVRGFEWLNCTGKETGRYTAFYIAEGV